jgi:hypothetical protein
MNTPTATIPKKISRGEELVVIRKKDFVMFQKWQEEMNDATAKVQRGRKEYQQGKTLTPNSPRSFR